MAKLRSGRTSFVIAHRLSAIRNADTIFLMDGRIVEQGDHAGPLRRHGAYYSAVRQPVRRGRDELTGAWRGRRVS